MTSREIRKAFLDFFASKGHKIVPSAPLVLKNDPTLMFTNSGMVQFKDYFLGNGTPPSVRIADTQKCLRVSGKHNDLEDVGFDGTHHTMFEMLGNWSFGDYFKAEAIDWSWELLNKVLGLPADRLYATVFGGDEKDGLASDEEARTYWRKYLPDNQILDGNKKDNFWEMGAQGPCGPCSEIHFDFRSDEERAKVPGEQLVNMDDPSVVEIWNNVFMQFERKADGSLVVLPAQHVDTGMGFERLCMILQGKKYTYDTDIFTPFIQMVEKESGKIYTGSYDRNAKTDVAMRVIVDHIRAVAFTIADGQLPAANGAGYVIRRILRRAVRYAYSFLDVKEPLLNKLIPLLASEFADVFPELKAQEAFVQKVILEEERSFLRTLELGLKRFETLSTEGGIVKGSEAFEMFDTYGFPVDLTELIARERGLSVDTDEFDKCLLEQKQRSKRDAEKQVGDWVVVIDETGVAFVGYDQLTVDDAKVLKYRAVTDKKGLQYQIVLNKTPFYAESGGQVGDTGAMYFDGERIAVLDTKKENDLVIHIVNELPENIYDPNVKAEVNETKRQAISQNHTATHLMHAALHAVLGKHAVQKGQNVDDKRLRFDFSHFQAATKEELAQIEDIVNDKICENIPLDEVRNMPIEDARKTGAMMLFGEKYGETVRVITFDKDFSQELCGGTHVQATGEIGLFTIVAESAVAAGVRRIEAVVGRTAREYIKSEILELDKIRDIFKNPKETAKKVVGVVDDNKALRKQIEAMHLVQASELKGSLRSAFQNTEGVNLLVKQIGLSDANAIKTLAANLDKEVGNAVIVFGSISNEKAQLTISISPDLAKAKNWNAGNMVRELAKEIKGGGGGSAVFATAGGTDTEGLVKALEKAKGLLFTQNRITNEDAIKQHIMQMISMDTIPIAVEYLDYFIQCYYDLMLVHHEDKLKSQAEADAKMVLHMMFSKLIHLKKILEGVSSFNKDGRQLINSIIDPTIVTALVRNIYETVCMFNIVYAVPNTEDKKQILYNLWVAAGLKYRQKFSSIVKTNENKTKVEKEKEAIDEYKKLIENTQQYRELNEMNQKKIQQKLKEKDYRIKIEDNTVRFLDWQDISKEAFSKSEIFNLMYTYMSLDAHPSNVSVFQFADMFKADEAYIGRVVFNLKFCIALSSIFLADFVKVFPNTMVTFENRSELEQIILNFSNRMLRGDEESISNLWQKLG